MSHDERVARFAGTARLLTGALVSVRKPTIAALPRPAVGAGLALAMACDIALPAQSAFLSTGYLKVAERRLRHRLATDPAGRHRRGRRELMFTCDGSTLPGARPIGLVNRVVPDDTLQSEPLRLAKSIAEVRRSRSAI